MFRLVRVTNGADLIEQQIQISVNYDNRYPMKKNIKVFKLSYISQFNRLAKYYFQFMILTFFHHMRKTHPHPEQGNRW